MVVQLYGFPISTCTLRVATTLKELDVPFEFHSVDIFKGEQKKAGYTAKQPFGQVPYIVDEDGFTLYESRAICRYLALKYEKQRKLVPSPFDHQAYGRFEQGASIEVTNFDPYASGAVFEVMFKPAFGLEADHEAGKALLATLEKKLEAYEVILSKQKYLAGDDFSLADLFHLPYGALLAKIDYHTLETGANGKPNVARWWKDITSRPTWQSLKDGVKA